MGNGDRKTWQPLTAMKEKARGVHYLMKNTKEGNRENVTKDLAVS